MDRAWLEQQLAGGRSIESIAREVDRDPSTVAYWIAKHRLVSSHKLKHAARGGIAREQLEPLVGAGLSVRAIGERLGVSYATVQHWLKKHGLKTRRAAAPRASDARTIERECRVHGLTTFERRRDGYFRCLACRADAFVKRRRAVKRILVRQKAFELSHRGATLALDAARAEVAKCVLLCANCHAEVEAGAATVR
jgi:transposase